MGGVRKSVERLTCELAAIRELCRISEISHSPALKAYAKEFHAQKKALESELNMRRAAKQCELHR